MRNFQRLCHPIAAAGYLFLFVVAGCASSFGSNPTSPAVVSSLGGGPTVPPPTATFTRTAPPTPTATPTSTPKWPLTLVFYGDSLLKIGEVRREAKWSYSFVDFLQAMLDPAYEMITANYGGRDAAWAAENLQVAVLSYQPDLVTLWWGFNDLLGCGGFFSTKTNKVIPEYLDTLVRRHIDGLRKQADLLLEQGASVMVLTSIPIDGKLPWTHFDENGQLVWEWNHLCDYNLGLERLASAQRELAEGYAAEGKAVFLVDLWRLFVEHEGVSGMYLDLMHPGPVGAYLIAEEWIRIFGETGSLLLFR
ncbi:MAG: SGNH/GDSL hydrolase family protein [Anaerolineales bacterium]|nr:SGNH/GDSL hydrolase family protein [Anaerolineales bacterium]